VDEAKARFIDRDGRPTKIKFARITFLRMGEVDYLMFLRAPSSTWTIHRAMDTKWPGFLANNILNQNRLSS